MKKKIFICLAIMAITAVTAWNVNFSSQANEMSDVALANVEALASKPKETACYIEKDTYESCNWFNDSYYCPCGSI